MNGITLALWIRAFFDDEIMVIPITYRDEEVMTTLVKNSDGPTTTEEHESFRFVSMVGDKA